MAAEDAFDAKPSAFENTIFEHRLHHVLAARRRITARRGRQRRNEHPVEIDREEEDFAEENPPSPPRAPRGGGKIIFRVFTGHWRFFLGL